MNKNIEFEGHRKIKDLWALILYITTFVCTNTVLLFNMRSTDGLKESFDLKNICMLFLKNTLCLAISVMISILMFIFTPKTFIYSSLIISTALAGKHIIENVESKLYIAIWLIFVLICFILYFVSIHSNIDYISEVISGSSRIIAKYIPSFVLIFTLFMVVSFAQVFIILITDFTKNIILRGFAILILLFFWNFAVSNYFYQVFVASVFVAHIKQTDEKKSVTLLALKNTLYSMGSICFGAFIIALIKTLRILESMGNNDNKKPFVRYEYRHSIARTIISLIGLFIKGLEFVFDHANNLCYPYMAIHGTSYTESIAESFKIVSDLSSRELASYLAVDLCLTLLGLGFLTVTKTLNDYLLPGTQISILFMKYMIIYISIIVFSGLLMMVSAGSLALVYLNICAPELIENYDKDLSDKINRKKETMVAKD